MSGENVKIIIVTGMPGAGKEEFVKVSRELGYDVVRMGDVVRIEAVKKQIPLDDQGIGGFAHSERVRLGYDIWAKRTIPLIKSKRTVIDGCRGEKELMVFKNAFDDDAVVVAIHSSAKTRYERLRRRNRSDAPTNFEEFKERDSRELGWGLGNLIALADYMIVNEGSLEEFKEQVRKLLKEINGYENQGC
ncbi:MAG: AAA family ATPase [Methanomassiliicoccales archaeon]